MIDKTFEELYNKILQSFAREIFSFPQAEANPNTVLAAALASLIDLTYKARDLKSPPDPNLLAEFVIKYMLQVWKLNPNLQEEFSKINFGNGQDITELTLVIN